jgi:hypothetical protein
MFAGRGILAMLTVVAIEMLGLFAKNSNSRALGALYDTARGFFFYNFVAFVEGFFWMALFGLLYIAHLALAPAFAKGMLEPMAYESFSLLKQYRILGIAPENEYPFFTFLLFFMASTFFGLFAVKKFNISLASGAFQIMREAKYGKGDGTGREKYEVWVRAYVRQEKLD